ITLAAIPEKRQIQISQEGMLLDLVLEVSDADPSLMPQEIDFFRPVDIPGALTGGDVDHASSLVVEPDGRIWLGGTPKTLESGTALISGFLNTTSPTGSGGTIAIAGNAIDLVEAELNAFGSGSGRILLDSSNQWASDLSSASFTFIDAASVLRAGERIELSSRSLVNRGDLMAPGGDVSLTGDLITLASGTDIDVSAPEGGGSVQIGTDPLAESGGTERILMVEDARIEANGLQAGAGGTIHLEADGLLLSGKIEATGISGTGGQVKILGDRIGLFGSRLDVSGQLGGGTLNVGGAFQGGGNLRRAQDVGVSSETSVRANADTLGDGGDVVFWADGTMQFGGHIQARGGVLGGDGGLVEVSGLEGGTFAGIVDAGAPLGTAGTLLLDPKNITIAANNVSLGTYSLAQTFLNPTPAIGDLFGVVAIAGNNLLIGALFDDTGATDAGSAYLFNTSGTLLQTINNPAPADFDYFGNLVAIDGSNLLIGAQFDDTGATDAGSVYLFNTSGNLLQTINNPTPASFDYFGHSVEIDGSNILISAFLDDTGAT
ncbi:MAG: hypothetical protein ACO3EZ_19005, partial [Prochlorotrichaceae cyanobacterium]